MDHMACGDVPVIAQNWPHISRGRRRKHTFAYTSNLHPTVVNYKRVQVKRKFDSPKQFKSCEDGGSVHAVSTATR